MLMAMATAGINNTDLNTRPGWCSKRVTNGTNSRGADGFAGRRAAPLTFPRLRGVDVAGQIVSAHAKVPERRAGQRVAAGNVRRHNVSRRPFKCWTFRSERDGRAVRRSLRPATRLACAVRIFDRSGETVAVTGASGGTGSSRFSSRVGAGPRIPLSLRRPKRMWFRGAYL